MANCAEHVGRVYLLSSVCNFHPLPSFAYFPLNPLVSPFLSLPWITHPPLLPSHPSPPLPPLPSPPPLPLVRPADSQQSARGDSPDDPSILDGGRGWVEEAAQGYSPSKGGPVLLPHSGRTDQVQSPWGVESTTYPFKRLFGALPYIMCTVCSSASARAISFIHHTLHTHAVLY